MTNFSNVIITCLNEDMWTRYEQFPEMAVKKNRSRPTPGFLFQVTGLEPATKYQMSVKLSALDNKKYKYGPVNEDGVQKNKWHPISANGTVQEPQLMAHNWVAQTGRFWMKKGVEFLKLFLCTVPNEDSFVVESQRVYTASLVIVDTETRQEKVFQMDCHKFVTVSSYRKQYQKPTEILPRAHTSPPILEGDSPSRTGACKTPFNRGLKRRQNEESSIAFNTSQMKKQKVYEVPTPPMHHQQYYGLKDLHAMDQPRQYQQSHGSFALYRESHGQPIHLMSSQNDYEAGVAGNEAQNTVEYANDFEAIYEVGSSVSTTSSLASVNQMAPIMDHTEESDQVYVVAQEDSQMPAVTEYRDYTYVQQGNNDDYESNREVDLAGDDDQYDSDYEDHNGHYGVDYLSPVTSSSLPQIPTPSNVVSQEYIGMAPAAESCGDCQQENIDCYEYDSTSNPLLWSTSSSSTLAEEALDSDGDQEDAADEYGVRPSTYGRGAELFDVSFEHVVGF